MFYLQSSVYENTIVFYLHMYMQVLPNPYPVPIFRNSTEVNLGKDILIDPDRKYMVQTLATMLIVRTV